MMYGLDNTGREALQKHLRTADEHFRQRNFDSALLEIDKALLLDPRNALARSFQERIRLASKQGQRPAGSTAPAAAPQDRSAMIPQLFRDVEQSMAKKDFHRAQSLVQEVLSIDPENFYAKAYLDTIGQQQQLHAAAVASAAVVSQNTPVPASIDPNRGSLAMYREMLKEFWFDGTISAKEAAELQSVREMFGITPLEHSAVEREVKVVAYVDALRTAWGDGVVSENEQRVLEMMRQRYSISAEEHLSAEQQIEVARRSRRQRGTILLVDGDMETLTGLIGELKRRNYDVLIAHYIDDAMHALVNRTPDAIISEIFFDERSADGFGFFQKLTELEHLRGIPFYFMSALDDDKVVRAGVRLGVHRFFRKPLDMKLIVAELEVALRKR